MAYRYPTRKVNGKTKQLHRHKVEQRLGRALRPDEHVHHRDHDPWNYADENLVVKDGLEHIREHAEERRIHPRQKPCHVCGTIFTPHRTKRKRAKTCSPECANKLRTGRPPLAEALVRANMVDQAAAAEREAA